MSIYELRCREGHRFEVIQSFTAPLPDCRHESSAGRSHVGGVTGGVTS